MDNIQDKLIIWAKSSQINLTEELINSVRVYFQECGANNAQNTIDCRERRKIVAKGIVIQCLYVLDKLEADKLEKALIQLCSTESDKPKRIRKGWADAFEKYAQDEQELLIPDYLLKEIEDNFHCSVNPNDKR